MRRLLSHYLRLLRNTTLFGMPVWIILIAAIFVCSTVFAFISDFIDSRSLPSPSESSSTYQFSSSEPDANTPQPAATNRATARPSATVRASATPSPIPSSTPSPTFQPTDAPTATPAPSATAEPTPTSAPSVQPSATPSD